MWRLASSADSAAAAQYRSEEGERKTKEKVTLLRKLGPSGLSLNLHLRVGSLSADLHHNNAVVLI